MISSSCTIYLDISRYINIYHHNKEIWDISFDLFCLVNLLKWWPPWGPRVMPQQQSHDDTKHVARAKWLGDHGQLRRIPGQDVYHEKSTDLEYLHASNGSSTSWKNVKNVWNEANLSQLKLKKCQVSPSELISCGKKHNTFSINLQD